MTYILYILESWIAIAFCSAAISFTLTTTSMFTWLREWISNIHPKLEELIHCPWCTNHYVVFTILLTSDVQLLVISSFSFYNFLFNSFLIIGMAGLIHYVLLRAYEPVAQAMLSRKLAKLRKQD